MTTTDNTLPSIRFQKQYNTSQEHSLHDQFNLGIAEFSRLYTTGEMTLCQAVTGLMNYVANASSGYGAAVKWADALAFVGHRLTFQDEVAVEVGFDGDINAWLAAGNLPQGWYCLFQDNYPGYSREMKRTYERNSEDAGCDSGDHPADG
jgi:hypothetical protein